MAPASLERLCYHNLCPQKVQVAGGKKLKGFLQIAIYHLARSRKILLCSVESKTVEKSFISSVKGSLWSFSKFFSDCSRIQRSITLDRDFIYVCTEYDPLGKSAHRRQYEVSIQYNSILILFPVLGLFAPLDLQHGCFPLHCLCGFFFDVLSLSCLSSIDYVSWGIVTRMESVFDQIGMMHSTGETVERLSERPLELSQHGPRSCQR